MTNNLIYFTNGVYDLENKSFCLEKVESEKVNVSYDYIQCNDNDEDVITVTKFFEQIMQNETERNTLLSTIAHFLKNNVSQQMIFWVGDGANGKSTTLELVKYTFDKLFGDLSNKFLTTSNLDDLSGNNLEFEENHDKKLLLVEEIEDQIIYSGKYKSLVANEFLLKEQQSNVSFLYVSNKMPSFDVNIDENVGLKRRIKIINFKSRFLENPDPLKLNEFKKNDNVDMYKLRQAFMWLLLNRYL